MDFFHRPEDFGFRDVGSGIKVDEIARRPMSLVAREAMMSMGPFGPAANIREMKIGDRLAIIALNAGGDFGGAIAEKGGQLLAEIVAAPRLEFLQECGRPLRAIILE